MIQESVAHIRNFAIIAHVDHGKSTLADRFLEITKVLKKTGHDEQYLDRNPISRERGITIKLAPVRMKYRLEEKNNEEYILNLIDTPGHVDFSYEVDRTLSCVEGVILLVDATQGIQAQTISNTYKAIDKNLVIIPAINKIDLETAEIEKTKKQLADFLGIKEKEIYEISAKSGIGVEKLLRAVVAKIPPPDFNANSFSETEGNIFRGLIFDSYYDSYQGVIAFVRVFNGSVSKGDKLHLVSGKTDFEVSEVGHFKPDLLAIKRLKRGEIGYIVTKLKNISTVNVGDTLLDKGASDKFELSGYKKINPLVFASIFPTNTKDFLNLKKGLEKLSLNDSSLQFSQIYSKAMGSGFKVGFLGVLHADIVYERLEREFDLSLVLTPPKVKFLSSTTVSNKKKFEEPFVKIMIVTPKEYLGKIIQLCQNYRAKLLFMDNKGDQIVIDYEMPMSEMITDFFDNLKTVSSGYASLDWEFLEYRAVNADKLDILINGKEVEEFSEVVVKERAFTRTKKLLQKIRSVIPRQQFEIRIQAKYKGKIIASERIAPFRKDVTAKLYGGDRTRKDKLLKKQKKGKKAMKMVGRVEIPKESFMKLFKQN